MTDLYFEVSALLGDECQCGGDFLKCSTEDGGCCSEEAIGDMTGYCGGDTMKKLYRTVLAVKEGVIHSSATAV